jgi:hypothetical protein
LEGEAVKSMPGMKIFVLAVLSLAACLTAAVVVPAQTGQGGAAPPTPRAKSMRALGLAVDLGKIEGRTYTNEQFGVSLDAPPGWTVLDAATMKAIQENAKNIFRDEKNAAVKRGLEEAVNQTTPLFIVSKFPPGTVNTFNATLVCAAERIPTAVIKTPRDYYDTMLHSMKLSQGLDVQVVEPFKVKRIGATDFGTYTLRITSNVGIMMQKQLISIKSPYAFGVVFTYTEEGDLAAFDKIVTSIKTK